MYLARTSLTLVLLVGSFMLTGCHPLGPDALFDDTVRLDQALVSAIMLVKADAGEAAQVSLEKCTLEWKRFDATHHESSGLYWEQRMTDASRHLSEAQEYLAAGQQVEATVALGNVQENLLRARERMGMLYFPDALVRFKHALDSLQGAPDPPGAPSPRHTGALSRYWDDVIRFEWKPEQYGLNNERRDTILSEMQTISTSLASLSPDVTISPESVTLIVQTADAGIDKILSQFGDSSVW